MTNSIFAIGADGVDTEKIVQDIQASVQKKLDDGVYDDARIARAERANLIHLRSEDEFLGLYLECLRGAAFVDTNDFEIRERRRGLAPILVPIKTIIWKLLKFYTYRLWSQQNEVNGFIVTAIEGLEQKHARTVKELEARIRKLEDELANRKS